MNNNIKIVHYFSFFLIHFIVGYKYEKYMVSFVIRCYAWKIPILSLKLSTFLEGPFYNKYNFRRPCKYEFF